MINAKANLRMFYKDLSPIPVGSDPYTGEPIFSDSQEIMILASVEESSRMRETYQLGSDDTEIPVRGRLINPSDYPETLNLHQSLKAEINIQNDLWLTGEILIFPKVRSRLGLDYYFAGRRFEGIFKADT